MRLVSLLAGAAALLGQSDSGELRIKVVDPAGLAVPGTVDIVSEANQIHQSQDTDRNGALIARRLPFGLYRIQIEHPGFAPFSGLIELRSAVPKELRITLSVAPVETTMTVSDTATLLDPYRTGTINRIGAEDLADRVTALPGRSLIDLVNTQPGWLLEANGVLHPRGSEYQTQYVVDGIPLTENRSPAFSPELEADDVHSMSIFTAGYAAEYGRKLGGVVDVTTEKDSRSGFHGKIAVDGGSFATAGGAVNAQYAWNRNTITLTGEAARTDRYLDPPVLQNFTNSGTNTNFSAHFERDLTDHDRFGVILRHAQSRFEVPNELVQQDAAQRQDRGTEETAGQFSYQHVFSPEIVADVRGMARDLTATLWSNPFATPIYATQDRGSREEYFKATTSIHHGHHEFKAGVETDFASLREAFAYNLTDRSQFDAATPPSFQFFERHPDREQALFAQDLIRFGNLTITAGLRWDHYSLLVDESAASPRLGVAWYWPGGDVVFRASYDRIFQTPAFENILLSSSPAVTALDESVLRLPVRPSLGNFYEAGFSKGLFGKLRLDANVYRRSMNNFADDDLLLNTGISFPISFSRAEIHGVEAKLELPRWGRFSGFASYSNMLGVGYLPVTGGLFLGDSAANALISTAGKFPVSQDQRNTVSARFRYELSSRVWLALGGAYGSGLPVEFDADYATALARYGHQIVSRVNFDRGRLRPSLSMNASIRATIWKKEKQNVSVQVDVQNLADRLNVINFAGLFSGSAIAAPRSAMVRLQGEF